MHPRASADLQDVIVGGAVLTAVSAALYNGLKVSALTVLLQRPCRQEHKLHSANATC